MIGKKNKGGEKNKKHMLSLFNQRILRTLIIVLAGARQVSVQQELDPFIKTISSVAICTVSIEYVTRNLTWFKIVICGPQ